MISFQDFQKLDIRIGKVTGAGKVEGTDKLVKMDIDFGSEQRQVIAGIADVYSPEDLVGKELPVLLNLEPRKIRGIESQGMILAADAAGKPVLLHPDREVSPGSMVR